MVATASTEHSYWLALTLLLETEIILIDSSEVLE